MLTPAGKLQGFESIAERNVFMSNQWHQLSLSEKESCCEEAGRKNEVAVDVITQCEKAELIKKHTKKLLAEVSFYNFYFPITLIRSKVFLCV